MFRKSVVVLLVAISLYAVAWATKGDGIPDVGVVLMKKPGGTANTRTDGNGNYTFTGVEPGTYSIELDRPGVKLETGVASNARIGVPAPIAATLTRTTRGGTDVTFAGQLYELSVAGRGVTVSDGTITQTSSGIKMQVNINVGGGTTTVSGTARKAKEPNPTTTYPPPK